MVRPKRVIHDMDLNDAVKVTAWKQIQEYGAAALSLRRIARELDIAAPSIYHYYPSRDELVTELIVDAFNSLAESQLQAITAASLADHAARLVTLAQAYRTWAVSYPQRYQLIFGTPIPGYVAPEEITLPAATAGFVPLTEVLQAAFMAGRLKVERLPPITQALKTMLEAWQEVEGNSHPEVLYLALVFWSRIHGLVTFEINGQYPSFITDPGEIFKREIEQIIDQYFN